MEVDGIDNTVAKHSSIPNDTVETSPISKNALTFNETKDFDPVSNDIGNSMDLEGLSNQIIPPPNGEQEPFGHISPEGEQIDEPVHNANAGTHLESNLNIIENQNNENLERDNELMETESTEPLGSISQPEVIEEPQDENSNNDLHKSSESRNPDSLEFNTNVSVQSSEALQQTDLSEQAEKGSNTDDGEIFDRPKTPSAIENEIAESVSDKFHSSEKPGDSTSDIYDRTKDDEHKNSSLKPLQDHYTEGTESVVEKDSERIEIQEELVSEDKDKSKSIPEAESLSEEGTIQKEINTSDSKRTEISVSESTDEIQRSESSEEPDKPGLDDTTDTDVLSSEKEIAPSIPLENETPDTSKNSEVNTSVNTTQETEIASSSSQFNEPNNEKDSTIQSSNEKSDSPEKKGIAESSTSIEENIEFAQVDFDSNEHEKDNEKATSKGNDLDPIAAESDVLESIENSQGADEEITIIPDSEREITEAEKEAASSLPTLKDISDKTKLPEVVVQDGELEDSEVKIYKYDKEDTQLCCECKEKKQTRFHFADSNQDVTYICGDSCLDSFKKRTTKKVTMVTDEGGGLRVKNFMEGPPQEPPSLAFIRKCASCNKITDDIEINLTWEIMDFCNEFCLSKYQKMIGSKCASCTGDVKSTSLGKYCVRFGNDIRQFCTSTCLEQYKKGLKVCSYCQQDMSNGPDGFLAPVGEKGQFKDFCSKICMEKYDIMTNDRPPNVEPGTICSVCKTEKPITIEFEHKGSQNYFCGEPCFVAFAFVNKITPGKCAMCRRHFNKTVLEKHTMYYDNVQYSFCSNSCENIYIIAHRKIVPCSWCKVKKYNFDMIKKYSKLSSVINMCSINCLNLYQVSLNAVNAKPAACNFCKKQSHPAYHLTMSDATLRNFCSYGCVMNFQNQYSKPITLSNVSEPIPTGVPQKNKKGTIDNVPSTINDSIPQLPVISNVQSLANTNGTATPPLLPPSLTPIPSTRLTRSKATTASPLPQSTTVQTVQNIQNIELPVQVQVKQHYIIKEKPPVPQRNVAIMCNPRKAVKAIQASPSLTDAGNQTEKEEIKKILIPVPVPIYVPTPCHMFAAPVPIPVPFPIPIPIPIFIPTTRNSAAGIMKEIKKIQVKIPTDPYEAELLMMAEMVAEEKKEEHTDSESDIDDSAADGGGDYSPEPVDASNTFGDDMLQIALKMATELDEPAVDLEGALTANTITAPQGAHPDGHPQEENVDDPQQPLHHSMMERSSMRGRKRSMRGAARGGQSKRGRRMSHHQVEMPMMQPVQPTAPPEPQEKPDANMCLKYTFGVNAWKQWVTTKNAELEKSSNRVKLFKTEILQLTSDELNYSLCLFVKEVRKPNGQEYAPDTIYYLCLGIQQYLFENGRIDNIFCDAYYEKFTDCLDEVAKKFSVLYNDSHYIVTRVEEEHLWESKQLGAHSPHVLLSTLMFFNTKHFNLTTVDEHMQLSFSHIMKHWKRNPNQPGASKVPGSRNVLLRFYPPQSALQNNQRKKKVYEQQENEENPLRCPVKLYEFYLSKCPESVKTRNDVFYLQPERSCVPDSPVWYSTMPLPKEALEKMLHRVKMVKEINVALLTS